MPLPFKNHSSIYFCLAVIICLGCKKEGSNDILIEENTTPTLFTLLSPEQTNISFQNTLTEGLNTNILMYEYFYNGGGVATGDFNGDGLIDIYFTSNMSDNKLFINLGEMKFQDVTTTSGASGRAGPWKTGVATVDINGDGKLDLYVCYSGALPEAKRANQLFINQGNDSDNNPLFIDQATEYGLASTAFSNQAYFFDYDRDGDLDAILLNHNPKSLPILNEVSTAEFLKKDDPLRGVRLYKQTDGVFDDVTEGSGISGSALTYGLGVGISDINNDGWPDFYVSNDYAVPDYLYINHQDGTFINKLQESVGHTSHFSMGNDITDVNNDGWQDVFTLDMLPEDNHRQKLLLSPDNYEKFDLNLRSGFHYQYMRNMLQLSNGNGTFSEVGQLAGISNTDWSWSALFADYDNDGWKDLLVTNGYYRDYTNLDFINYMENYVQAKGNLKREHVLEVIKNMPASDVVNYIFSNTNGTTFSDKTKPWGLDHPANSNGAAYADLDNDGDLDLVINNINQPAFIYRNESQEVSSNHYLQVKLLGEGKNSQGLGAKVEIHRQGKKQSLEQATSRGYLSAVSPVLHFGLGVAQTIDSLIIIWNSGKQQTLVDISVDQLITLEEKNASIAEQGIDKSSPIFSEVPPPIEYENAYAATNDFKRQPLLISQLSHSGPCMVKGDINKDGMDDIFIGGVKGQSAALYIQQKNMRFLKKSVPAFEIDIDSEDVDAAVFDANGDGHQDIYVASGGYHSYSKNDPLLQDRLYVNDGKGNFSKSAGALPEMKASKGCVAVNDVNQDGHPDLFVGGRVVPGRYPETPLSYLLINDGRGNFTNQINVIAPELENFGMITDAVWVDIDADKVNDLVVVGEWLPVSVFITRQGKLQNQTGSYFDRLYRGWWNKIEAADFNKDNKPDLIVGNMGTNTQFHVSEDEPAEMYFKDFDNNDSVDPIFCYYIQGKSYPYVTRGELLNQLSSLRSRYADYESYADVTIRDIFDQEELRSSEKLAANHMETTLFSSTAHGKFEISPLPVQVQYAPIHTITVSDFNNDGNDDILMFGNDHHTKLRLGKFDANYGTLLAGNGKGVFQYVEQSSSGLNVQGAVRSVVHINHLLLLGINQRSIKAYELSMSK